jgi:hypothetical protein
MVSNRPRDRRARIANSERSCTIAARPPLKNYLDNKQKYIKNSRFLDISPGVRQSAVVQENKCQTKSVKYAINLAMMGACIGVEKAKKKTSTKKTLIGIPRLTCRATVDLTVALLGSFLNTLLLL